MNYVSCIADSMLARLENASVLGPEVYTAIAEWEKREIPLAVILDSIDEVCGKTRPLAGQVLIEQVQETVIKRFRQWLADGGDARSAAA